MITQIFHCTNEHRYLLELNLAGTQLVDQYGQFDDHTPQLAQNTPGKLAIYRVNTVNPQTKNCHGKLPAGQFAQLSLDSQQMQAALVEILAHYQSEIAPYKPRAKSQVVAQVCLRAINQDLTLILEYQKGSRFLPQ